MKLRLKTLIIFLLIAFKVFAQTPALILPDFTFYKSDNTLFTDKNIEPNKMLFFFFFDVDCEHCQHAMMNLDQHYTDYKKAAIYLISLAVKEKVNHFMNEYASNLKNQKNVTILQDTKNQFIEKFKPRRYPAMFLYSAEKKLVDYEDNEDSMFRFINQLNKSSNKSTK